ncbi:MAG: hypothetical protein ACOCRX_03960 [Candidatus Woesearchaeota archaeon]
MGYREIAIPQRYLITNKEEYINFIRKYNGVTNLYESLYRFKYLKNNFKPDYESAIIDRMFFDFDSENALSNTIKFHNYLKKYNIKHYIKQSSYMKFHIYVLCKGQLQNKKHALTNAMYELIKDVGFSVGKGAKYDVDVSTFGDLSRICPIAGTYKPKKKSYCNYITPKELFDRDKLLEKSKKPFGYKHCIGSRLINLENYDYEPPTFLQNIDFEIEEFNVKFNDKYVNILPPFIKKILANYKEYGNWENRWRFAVLCRDFGYPKNLTDKIAKRYFSRVTNMGSLNGRGTNYDHFIKFNVLKNVYEKQEKYKFPNVNKLIEEGYEIETEDIEFFRDLYY